MKITSLGDGAFVIEVADKIGDDALVRVQALLHALEQNPPRGTVEFVPSFTTVAVFYDPEKIDNLDTLRNELVARVPKKNRKEDKAAAREIVIPVCYGGEFGPDLAEVAVHAGLSEAEAAALHHGAVYRVHAVGFAPGFPYLAGLPEKLHTPRRATPRTGVPAGSVGIGGAQSGIYPIATPGGWQLIGRTPLRLFRPEDDADAALLRPGDRVRFQPLSPEEFAAWK
ncbi:MAG TPA: 5-oxoprolinase subunit PxpB [Opitutaceae bacterium]|nr:5-oxoprolinase subunit PxpB [Opitutaceae bacterium]